MGYTAYVLVLNMKKIFISVPTKLLLLVVGALLLLSAGFSIMSLTRLNQEFEHYQAENKQQGQAQFKIQSTISRDQIRTWIESFADVVHVKEQDDFSELTQALAQQFDALQLNQNVENVWLIDQQEQLLFSSVTLPEYIADTVKSTFHAQEPQYQLFCQLLCEQLITVPLLNRRGDMVIVAMTVSLVDVIYAINQSVKSDIAIVSYANHSQQQFNRAQFVSASNSQLVKSLFVDQGNTAYINSVIDKGLQIDIASGNFLVNLLPLALNSERSFYMAIIDDVTPFNVEFSEYRRQFLLSALLIFVTLAILVYFVSSPFTRRLLVLSNVLPLLARKEFDKFRKIEIKSKRLVRDELDILADASLELSYELEQLNLEVEQKTKELENIAMYDLLTGLPNRNMLNYQLRKSVVNIGLNIIEMLRCYF